MFPILEEPHKSCVNIRFYLPRIGSEVAKKIDPAKTFSIASLRLQRELCGALPSC